MFLTALFLRVVKSRDYVVKRYPVTKFGVIIIDRTKCWLPAFSPFPTMFLTALFLRVVKSRDYVVKRYQVTKFGVIIIDRSCIQQVKYRLENTEQKDCV